MKRIALFAVTAITALAPLAGAPAFAAPPQGYEQNDGGNYARNHDDDRYNQRDQQQDTRDTRRDDQRNMHRGHGRGEVQADQRWDHRQHNGYTVNGQWHYGAPSAAYYGRPDFHPGYQAWQRGQRVPTYYRDSAHRVDYRQYRDLRAPPRGYQYVRDDRGSVLLIGIATGVILSTILTH